jgi:hypothetical protein
VRIKSAGRDSRSPWMQEPDAGSSALSQLVQLGCLVRPVHGFRFDPSGRLLAARHAAFEQADDRSDRGTRGPSLLECTK